MTATACNDGADESDGTQRIDKLLWHLRLVKTRAKAKAIIEKGRFRINGERVKKAHYRIRCDDVLTLVIERQLRIIRIIQLPERRGPATEAQACYVNLDHGIANAADGPED